MAGILILTVVPTFISLEITTPYSSPYRSFILSLTLFIPMLVK
ncbi:hypothetical protein [Clostridium neonatale]